MQKVLTEARWFVRFTMESPHQAILALGTTFSGGALVGAVAVMAAFVVTKVLLHR
jgi:hypothetical protein